MSPSFRRILTRQWWSDEWLEARWGLIYVSFVLTFITAATVTYTDLPLVHSIFPDIIEYYIVGIVLGGFVAAPIIGHFHGKLQNPTDVLKGNKPLLDAVRKIVREELGR